MQIEIRRYHLILVLIAFIFFLSIGTISRESVLRLKDFFLDRTQIQSIQKKSPSDSSQSRTGPEVAINALSPKNVRPSGLKVTLLPDSDPTNVKKIALTFDDGPHPVYTERLLKMLQENQVSATFFVVGKQVELYPHLVQKIFRDGHELANHSYSHRDLRTISPEELTLELDKTHRLVELITEQKMKFFRPPGGQYNADLIREAGNLGYSMVLWNIFPKDHSNPSAETIRHRILKAAQNNGVILLHSGIENTLQVLPDIISSLQKKGYVFVTLSQMDPNILYSMAAPFKANGHETSSLMGMAHSNR